MKKPRVPPNIWELLNETTGKKDRITTVFDPRLDLSPGGKYLHWDQIINYPPPSDLTHREWWLALKMQRMNARKQITLRDDKGVPFGFGLSDPIPERLHAIDLGAGGSIQMPEQITNPETKDRYYIGSLIEEAITSSQLEGATTTRQVAKEMIRAGRTPRDRSERMILNNFLTMQRISKLKEERLTKELIFEVHRLVTEGTWADASAAGRFRQVDEPVVVGDDYGEVYHCPPPAHQLEERMEAMCKFANGETPGYFIHPAIRSIILHFWLAYDHPFLDGNGRTARALFYWSMLHGGYWLFEFLSISQIILKAPVQYERAFLYSETDDNDLTYFILYHLEVVRRAIEHLHEYIRRKTSQIRTLEAELRGTLAFNHRQRSLVSHALRHPNSHYTIQSHRTSHNVVYETARTDLLELEKAGLLIRERHGRAFYFVPAPNMEEKLAKSGADR